VVIDKQRAVLWATANLALVLSLVCNALAFALAAAGLPVVALLVLAAACSATGALSLLGLTIMTMSHPLGWGELRAAAFVHRGTRRYVKIGVAVGAVMLFITDLFLLLTSGGGSAGSTGSRPRVAISVAALVGALVSLLTVALAGGWITIILLLSFALVIALCFLRGLLGLLRCLPKSWLTDRKSSA